MKISNRRLRKIRKIKNQTRKRNKSHKRRHKKGGKKRSFRRKNYVNLRRQTLKRQRGGGFTVAQTKKEFVAKKKELQGAEGALSNFLRTFDKKYKTTNANRQQTIRSKPTAKEKYLRLSRKVRTLTRTVAVKKQQLKTQLLRAKQKEQIRQLAESRRKKAQGMPPGEEEEDQQLQQQQARIDHAITGLSPDELQPSTTAEEDLAEIEKEQAEQEKQAAPKIQKTVRGWQGRKKAKAVRRQQKQQSAVKKIQRVVRRTRAARRRRWPDVRRRRRRRLQSAG